MIDILAIGLASIVLLLGFLTAKVCKLISTVDKGEKYTGGIYQLLGIILAVAIIAVWLVIYQQRFF